VNYGTQPSHEALGLSSVAGACCDNILDPVTKWSQKSNRQALETTPSGPNESPGAPGIHETR
jgi:hypothetical protein